MFLKFLSKEHAALLSFLIKFVDIVLYLFCALIIYYLLFGNFDLNLHYKLALLISLFLLNPIFSAFGVYQSLRGKQLLDYLRPLFTAFIVLMILLASIAFISKTGTYYSREWFLYYNFLALLTLITVRILVRHLLHIVRKRGKNLKRIIIFGSGNIVNELIQKINQTLWIGYEIVAIFDNDSAKNTIGNFTINSIPDNLNEYIEKNNITEVWFAKSFMDENLEEIMNKLQENVVAIRYFPNIKANILLNHTITEMLGFPVVNIVSSPIIGLNRLYKRLEDILVSLIILIVVSPLFILIAALIKFTSSGPIFYIQERIGWNGEKFNMLKFRTMPVNVESSTGAIWAKVDDNRATKLGALLRKTSLDELPQFFNVLKGEMSIVGPRPERPVFVEKFKKEIPAYMHKHLVKGGITGWAQVNGWRGSTSLAKRIEYDIYYINNWSLLFDLKIILLTIVKGFINKNAY